MEINYDAEIANFVKSLQESTIAKVLRTVELLETFGHNLGMPHSKKIAPNLFELRVRGIQEVRLFYTFYKNKIMIIHGFIKKSQRIPMRELKQAINKLKALDNT